jgi:hypothetical protein
MLHVALMVAPAAPASARRRWDSRGLFSACYLPGGWGALTISPDDLIHGRGSLPIGYGRLALGA